MKNKKNKMKHFFEWAHSLQNLKGRTVLTKTYYEDATFLGMDYGSKHHYLLSDFFLKPEMKTYSLNHQTKSSFLFVLKEMEGTTKGYTCELPLSIYGPQRKFQRLSLVFEKGKPYSWGLLIARIKGGFKVAACGFVGFMPQSHLLERSFPTYGQWKKAMKTLLKKIICVKVLEFHVRYHRRVHINYVLSRKDSLRFLKNTRRQMVSFPKRFVRKKKVRQKIRSHYVFLK